VVGGIVAIATSASTLVTQESTPPPGVPSRSAAWNPTPTWREVTAEERALPPVVGASLWTGRF